MRKLPSRWSMRRKCKWAKRCRKIAYIAGQGQRSAINAAIKTRTIHLEPTP